MKDIKLIISDLDGTLLYDEERVEDRIINAITEVRKKGILFGIATARVLEGIEECAEAWGISHLCDVYIGANGSQIIDKTKGTRVVTHKLTGEECHEIFNHFKDLNVNFHVFSNGFSYSYKEDRHSKYFAQTTGFKGRQLDPVILFTEPQMKIIITTETAEYMDVVIEHAKSLRNEKYKGVSTWETDLEYYPSSVSKANGIKEILKNHEFSMQNILAFGDADNDVEMLKESGMGVCVGNGTSEAKLAADYVIDSNSSDGVAIFLEENILLTRRISDIRKLH